jgi:hypothetical protein
MPGASTLRDCKLLENVVRKHVEKGKLYAAICAAPAVALGAWGLLNGLKVIFSIFIPFSVLWCSVSTPSIWLKLILTFSTGNMLPFIHG